MANHKTIWRVNSLTDQTSSSGKVFFLLAHPCSSVPEASPVRIFLDAINEHFSEYIQRRENDFIKCPEDNKGSNESTQNSENLVKSMPMVRLFWFIRVFLQVIL